MKKKLLFLLFLLTTTLLFSEEFPYKNPYVATVLGTPLELQYPHKKVRYKTKTLRKNSKVKELWYLKKFKYGTMIHHKKSPLIFVLAGTGAKFNALKNVDLGSLLYSAGYSVVLLPTSFDYSYINVISKTHAPGNLKEDSEEIYQLVQDILEKIKGEYREGDISITGYSLGGSTSLMIGSIDAREKKVNFRKILALNPSVNLYDSAVRLDKTLDDFSLTAGELNERIDKYINILVGSTKHGRAFNLNFDEILKLYKEKKITNSDFKLLIGLVFRHIALDVSYISDRIEKTGIFSSEDSEKLWETFSKLNYPNFQWYIKNIGMKIYKKYQPGISFKEIKKLSGLKQINSYLKNSSNTYVITNRDDIILSKKDVEFLEKTFKDRGKFFDIGGHCGNILYTKYAETALSFLKEEE